jgi:hypothetical protein
MNSAKTVGQIIFCGGQALRLFSLMHRLHVTLPSIVFHLRPTVNGLAPIDAIGMSLAERVVKGESLWPFKGRIVKQGNV